MTVRLEIRNESGRKGLCRRDVLRRLAERICSSESIRTPVDLSVLFCDDAFIRRLNRTYRNVDRPTDVLAFSQEDAPRAGSTHRVLGDLVISLQTVERRCRGDAKRMREEIRLLFCHGLLHLLGYKHGSAAERKVMNTRQAELLGIPFEAAWHAAPERTLRRRRE